MMTIVTRVKLKEGSEPEWDAALRERLAAAKDQPGWIGGQLLMPLDTLNERVIIGTWQSRADWEAWHADEAFTIKQRPLTRPCGPAVTGDAGDRYVFNASSGLTRTARSAGTTQDTSATPRIVALPTVNATLSWADTP